ncbi:SRPBCC family protein [Oscillatoria sp. FACHB-1407]|uniref:SRPBCC family protein n=1 Tax=Oscillatoria sp. FACHB-1407 TaxID=2692847 RepID=UPI0016878097|nr:SRPBCC family protein [Oscillatoria sp. FACHB-1407]MBD2465642.1 SRPBCC family protein [Oscillatoria sp. FACHB-1407]
MNGIAVAGLSQNNQSESDIQKLLKGEILLETKPYSAWGGAVTARMYLPLERSQVWQQVTDYSRWVQYFPALSRSEVLHRGDGQSKGAKRLYQVASKAFLMFTAQVEIYLKVFESIHQKTGHQIQFSLERGSFTDFSANLNLQDFKTGTLLTYSVQATPTVLVPSLLIQEAMRLDLPSNLQKMRQVLCGYFR